MISAERCSVHVWRLAYHVGELYDPEAHFAQMIADTPERDREAMRRLTSDAAALLRSDAWQRGLRTMRELRWSSY
jgi:hypothetical protein